MWTRLGLQTRKVCKPCCAKSGTSGKQPSHRSRRGEQYVCRSHRGAVWCIDKELGWIVRPWASLDESIWVMNNCFSDASCLRGPNRQVWFYRTWNLDNQFFGSNFLKMKLQWLRAIVGWKHWPRAVDCATFQLKRSKIVWSANFQSARRPIRQAASTYRRFF